MNHELIGNPISVGISLWEITVRLIPENESESKTIHNVEVLKANNSETELINNYLLFGISGWSTLNIKSQNDSIFRLRVTNS